METRQRLLVIDDDPMIHKLVEVRIRDLNVNVICATDGASGVQMAHAENPHLILLDVGLPDMTGFKVCSQLRDDPLTREIPIIFLTGTDESEEKVRAFELGAVDYVTKPFNPAELRARVRAALRTQSLLEALETQALSDRLTRLPNREAFRRAVSRCIEYARQNPVDYKFAVMFLDLDRFKTVNDSLGHAAGDHLLVSTANALYQCIRQSPRDLRSRMHDVVARLGGDEFAVLLHDISGVDDITPIAERIQRGASQSVEIDGHQVTCSASIGIRIGDASCDSVDDLMRDSDTAMYHAKHEGKARYSIFTDDMREEAVHRLKQDQELRQAVEQREFQVVYQPIVDLRTTQIVSLEALARWNHPERGWIEPKKFIRAAEESGCIVEIGRWMLREACHQALDWNRKFGCDVKLNVNVSRMQLASSGFVADVAEILRETQVVPSHITLEVTESVMVHESREVVPVLQQLKGLGVKLAMDDFGTGYSSLISLHRFPIDAMKIDREFITRLSNNRPYAAIVNAIVCLAHNLNLAVIAKGVETEEQLALLLALDCDQAQGFHFDRPLSVEEVESLLAGEATKHATAA